MFYIPKPLQDHCIKSANTTGTEAKGVYEEPGILY